MLNIKRLFYFVSIIISLGFLSACSESGYLLQCVKGQLDLMLRAKPIEDVLAQSAEHQDIRDQLTKLVSMREFAVESLHLPDSGSYRKYADLERPYAVWNLVVAPELSLDLNQWCFPFAGCVTYRGYFNEMSANTVAKDYSSQGYDVDVYGVQAYSTLNWFDDPVLNTFLNNDEIRLATLLFHEMAHQIIYVPNDTSFNESFAKTVEMEGLHRWLQNSGSDELWLKYLQRESQSAVFIKFIENIRNELRDVYTSNVEDDHKRLAKQEILTNAYDEYELLKQSLNGFNGYDKWMQRGLNNARLSSLAVYYDLVPAFQSLLQQADYDLQKFYAEVKTMGALPAEERFVKLQSITPYRQAALN